MNRLMLFICVIAMALCPCGVFAAPQDAQDSSDPSVKSTTETSMDQRVLKGQSLPSDADIVEADSLDEYISLTAPDLSDEALDNDSRFGLCRVLVMAEVPFSYGAIDAVCYEGETVLTFACPKDTRIGYEALVEDFGEENVLLDEPMSCTAADMNVSAQTSSDPVTGEQTEPETPSDGFTFTGWGARYMGLNYQLGRYVIAEPTDPDPATEDPGEGNFDDQSGEEGTPGEGEDIPVTPEPEVTEPDPITVAVLDSGINAQHEIFNETTILEESRNFVGEEIDGQYVLDPADISDYTNESAKDYGHGTKVSGIIAESTPSNTQLLVLKVMNSNRVTTRIVLMQAISYAIEQGADIVNMSFGGNCTASDCAIIDAKMAEAVENDMILCAAFGNGYKYRDAETGTTSIEYDLDREGINFYPAESPYVIAVGAVDANGDQSSFSNYGSNLDFVAPGAGLTTADSRGVDSYSEKSDGTSFSCPYFAASAVYLKMQHSNHSQDTVKSQLRSLSVDRGDEGWDPKYGYGIPMFAEDTVLTLTELSNAPKITAANCVYTGKQVIPQLSVTYNGELMTAYEVKPVTKCTNIGTHKIRITLRGNYTDEISEVKSFKIIPQPISLQKITYYATGKKAGFTWNKGQAYNQIQVSTAKSFAGAKTWTTTDKTKIVSGLKSGKTYYVRVRTFKKVNGKKYYSDWSEPYKFKNKYPN